MTRMRLAVLMGAVFFAALSLTAAAADNDALREMQDRVQIEKLMWTMPERSTRATRKPSSPISRRTDNSAGGPVRSRAATLS